MTRDDVIRMAREAGVEPSSGLVPYLEDFAGLVAAAEREACAKVCEDLMSKWSVWEHNGACKECAAAIRARRNNVA